MFWMLMMAGLATNVFLLDKAFGIFDDGDDSDERDPEPDTEPTVETAENPDVTPTGEAALEVISDQPEEHVPEEEDFPGGTEELDVPYRAYPAPEVETLDWPHPRFDGPVRIDYSDRVGILNWEYEYEEDGSLVDDEDDSLFYLSDQEYGRSDTDDGQVITGGEGKDLFYVDLTEDMQTEMAAGKLFKFTVTDFDAANEVILTDVDTPPDEITITPQDDGSYTEVFLRYGEEPDTAGGVSIRLDGLSDLAPEALGQIDGLRDLGGGDVGFNVLPMEEVSRTVTEDVSVLETASSVTTSDADQDIALDHTNGASLTTGAGDDTIQGDGANVVINSGAGNDVLDLRTVYTGDDTDRFEIDLGDGADDLTMEGAAGIADLRDGSDDQITVKVTPETLGAGHTVHIDAGVAESSNADHNLPDGWDNDNIHFELAGGTEGYLFKVYVSSENVGESIRSDNGKVRIFFSSDSELMFPGENGSIRYTDTEGYDGRVSGAYAGDPVYFTNAQLIAVVDLGEFELVYNGDQMADHEIETFFEARAEFVLNGITSNVGFEGSYTYSGHEF